jgi:hypothetical protein
MNIDRPVFIIGMPRSGSTALHALLALHPAFATTTNITRKFPAHFALLKLAALLHREHQPGESGRMWDRFVGPDSDVLLADDITPRARAFYMQSVANVLRLYSKSRFLSKCPRNGLRIEFLAGIFPDALFIHLVRDGRAVCRSVLERRQRAGDLRAWWDAKPADWKIWTTLDPVPSVAHQWLSVVEFVRETGERLGPDRFIEVRYEDFVTAPDSFLEKLCRFSGVQWPGSEAMIAATKKINNRNDKWSSAFTPAEISVMNEIMAPGLRLYNYIPA